MGQPNRRERLLAEEARAYLRALEEGDEIAQREQSHKMASTIAWLLTYDYLELDGRWERGAWIDDLYRSSIVRLADSLEVRGLADWYDANGKAFVDPLFARIEIPNEGEAIQRYMLAFGSAKFGLGRVDRSSERKLVGDMEWTSPSEWVFLFQGGVAAPDLLAGESARIERAGAGLWTVFQRHSTAARRFGGLELDAFLYVGDGGKFTHPIRRYVYKGLWDLWRLDADRGDAVLAIRNGAVPARFQDGGTLCVESGIGAFIPSSAQRELAAAEIDEHFVDDVIVEAVYDDTKTKGAIVFTPLGNKLAVFRVRGGKRFTVIEGVDTKGHVCVVGVINAEEASG